MMTPSSNTSHPPTQETPFQQMSVLDIFFPGASLASSTIRQILAGDRGSYAHLMCLFGLLGFLSPYIYKSKAFLEGSFTSTVYVQSTDETYNMVLEWISSRGLDGAARSSIVRVKKQNGRQDPIGKPKKALSFSPWHGSFIFRHRNSFLSYRTSLADVGFRKEEELSITCLGRSPKTVKDFLNECKDEYLRLNRNKTTVFRNRRDCWERAAVIEARPLSTVILADTQKQSLIKDVGEFFDKRTRRWYSTRSVPYRKGILFYGPPGTGKTSLSLSVAGRFGLDIYTASVSTVNDQMLHDLFTKLPPQCIVLLEDIDAATATHCRGAGDGNASKTADKESVTLSGLLNAFDGVASQEGRLLIMTTNHIRKLDDALIRPGRIDRKVEFQLVDRDLATQIYRLVFEEPADVVSTGKSQAKDQLRVEQLSIEFAAKIPGHEFSPAEVLSFLIPYRDSPSCALENVEEWAARTLQEKRSKKAGPSEDGMSNRDKTSANHGKHLLSFLKFWG